MFSTSVHISGGHSRGRSTASVGSSSSGLQARIRDLEEQTDRLLLINEALWRILEKKLDVEEIDLIEQITQIDLEDGKLDHPRFGS